MIRIYLILGLLIAALGGTVYVQHLRSSLTSLKNENITLQGNVTALEKKIRIDQEVLTKDATRAVEDVKRITRQKEKSREIIQGTKSPDRPALDADATQRVRDIFAIH